MPRWCLFKNYHFGVPNHLVVVVLTLSPVQQGNSFDQTISFLLPHDVVHVQDVESLPLRHHCWNLVKQCITDDVADFLESSWCFAGVCTQ